MTADASSISFLSSFSAAKAENLAHIHLASTRLNVRAPVSARTYEPAPSQRHIAATPLRMTQ